MWKLLGIILVIGFAASSPAKPILRKLDPIRYQYVLDSNGQNHLADLWMTLDDIAESARYNPTTQNIYHLFTRANPSNSNPLLFGNEALLANSNFDSTKRVIILIHGWRADAISEFNAVLVPAYLAAEDVNVIVVDWSAGASTSTINYPVALENSIQSGFAVAQFIDWLNRVTGVNPIQYHIVGHGLGGHQAGIVGRHATGDFPYITGLDPAFVGWINHPDRFHPDDGIYTEVIHTNVATNGFVSDLAVVDFYPNGGEGMPGCSDNACDHAMSFRYFAESLQTGGFTGRLCLNYLLALFQQCTLPSTLQMGGLRPKLGFAGVYSLQTNASPPFSQG